MDYKQEISPSCRTCEHSKDFHYPGLGKPRVPPLPCRYGAASRNLTISCMCKEYLPEDNLEYLEYMHEKETTLP